ncbi:MAG: hypothetical protein ACE5Q6_14530 [Dehalococcoidia bacterium]
MSKPLHRPPNDLWAITTYFNPCGYRNRYRNYGTFFERLQVPLLTVELAYGVAFELTSADADKLIQLRSDQVMWQKERLINLALPSLPAECRKVVWLDCDLIFERDDWARLASQALDDYVMVQPFRRVYDLKRDADLAQPPEDQSCLVRESMAAWYLSGASSSEVAPDSPGITQKHGLPRAYSVGHAWAMRREALEQVGLYDALVLGGGDYAVTQAATGAFESVIRDFHFNTYQARHYLDWAEGFHRAVGGNFALTSGDIYHLWHGQLADRRYVPRHSILPGFDFDPYRDIAIDGNGGWRWNSDKPELHEAVRQYFQGRREDGGNGEQALANLSR